MTKKPKIFTSTVYTVAFQLADCCNVVAVFSSREEALADVENHALGYILMSGANEYPDTALPKHRELMADLGKFQLVVRKSQHATDETWIDLRLIGSDDGPAFQPAMFTITRMKLDVPFEDDALIVARKIGFIHAPPKAVQ